MLRDYLEAFWVPLLFIVPALLVQLLSGRRGGIAKPLRIIIEL